MMKENTQVAQENVAKKIQMVPLNRISPNPLNPRKNVGDVSELAASIKKVGILQNLTIINDPKKPGYYVNLIGHKRAVAAKRAGLTEVPCEIKESMEDKDQIYIMCIENIQRDDLTPLEQADAFQLMLDLGSTEADIASKTGFSKATIRNRIKIARAKIDPDKIKAKEKERNFQMTLADLGALAEIKDAEIRDAILSDAKNSAEIQWKCEEVKKKAKIAERENRLKKMIAALGIEDAPKKAYEDRYTSQPWPTKKTFFCENDQSVPNKLTLEDLGCDENGMIDGQKAFFMNDYNHYWSIVTRPVKKNAKKELTKEEQRRRDLVMTDKLIRAKTQDIALKRRDFILALIEHKIPKVKETPELMRMLWDEVMFSYDGINREWMSSYLYEKNYMTLSNEEKKLLREKLEKLSICEQLLIALAHAVDLSTTVRYGELCEFNEMCAAKIRRVDEILANFGFTYDDEGILDGTYKGYVKKEQEEKELTDSSEEDSSASMAGAVEASGAEAVDTQAKTDVETAGADTLQEEKPEVLQGEVEEKVS